MGWEEAEREDILQTTFPPITLWCLLSCGVCPQKISSIAGAGCYRWREGPYSPRCGMWASAKSKLFACDLFLHIMKENWFNMETWLFWHKCTWSAELRCPVPSRTHGLPQDSVLLPRFISIQGSTYKWSLAQACKKEDTHA